MVANNQETEMITEMFQDIQKKPKLIADAVTAQDMKDLAVRGYTNVLKLPEKYVDEELAKDNSMFCDFISVRDGYYYIKLHSYKMTPEEISAVEDEYTHAATGQRRDIEAELEYGASVDDKALIPMEELVTKCKFTGNRAEPISKLMMDNNVISKSFEEGKKNLVEIIKGCYYSETWKTKILGLVNSIDNKNDLDKLARRLYDENQKSFVDIKSRKKIWAKGTHGMEGTHSFYGDEGALEPNASQY